MNLAPLADEARWLARLPAAVLVVHDGIVVYANEAARRLFDPVAQQDLAGQSAARLMPAGSRFAASLTSAPTTFNGHPAVLHLVRDAGHEVAPWQGPDARLPALSVRWMRSQEDERRHVARELHDEIGQCLSVVRLQLAKAERRVGQPEGLDLIVTANVITERIMRHVRGLSQRLYPPQLETLGLVAALRWHLEEEQRLHGLPIRLDSDVLHEPVAPEKAIGVYRIVQEALSNALRHARASLVTVTLRCTTEGLSVSISDDGVGFAVEAADGGGTAAPRLGLLGMAERARLLGGVLNIGSAPGLGTWIAARLPPAAAPNHVQTSCDPGR